MECERTALASVREEMREAGLYFSVVSEKFIVLILLPSSVTLTKNEGRVNYIKSKLHRSSRLVSEAQSLHLCFVLACAALPFMCMSAGKNWCDKQHVKV